MGWSAVLSSRSQGQVANPKWLWSPEEAELSAAVDSSRVGFVRVGLAPDVEPAMALPPMVQCFDDTLSHFGSVELSGLQVAATYLRPDGGSSSWHLTDGLGWFSSVPGPRAEAMISFNTGLLERASESSFLARLRELGAGFFEFGPRLDVPPELSIDTTMGVGPDGGLTPAEWGVPVTLPDWSAGSAAWALATVIAIARSAGPGPRDFAVRLTRVR